MAETTDDELKEEGMTPRVAEALVRAARVQVPGEDSLLEETIAAEEWTSWDSVQDRLKKMSLPNLDFILKPCSMKPAPGSGIWGRVDLAIEYLKGIAMETRTIIREEERLERLARKEQADRENAQLNAALLIQSWFRGWVPRRAFLHHMRATASKRHAKKMADIIAKKWQRAGPPPDSAVVWLHDRGENEAAYQQRFSGLTKGNCRWVWPRAPPGPNGIRQWFRTPELPVGRVIRGVPDRPRKGESPDEVSEAVIRIHMVLQSLEAEGVPAGRVVLGGCGQGGVLAAHAALRYPQALAGVVLVSAWVTCLEELAEAKTPEGCSSQFLWCHGAGDAVVHSPVAIEHKKQLQELGVSVDFALLAGLRRGVDDEVRDTMQTWIADRLPEAESIAVAAG